MLLEAKNVSKKFIVREVKNRRAEITPLDSATLSVEKGEKVGIIGKSGEGKSTLARIICGFTKPDGGNVYFEGKPLFDSKNRYDRKAGVAVQMLPQQPLQSLDPTQRAGKAVEEALIVSKNARTRKEAKRKTEALFERVWLDKELTDRLPSQLSGGQAQRVAIARALAQNPKIIIADEATSMLDISSQAQVVRLFETLVKEDGLTVLFISHDESLVKAFADRSYRLTDGKFTEM